MTYNQEMLSSIQNDSFPTVVLEAMSCGIPTVAYKCGGVEEMIVDGINGFLVEKNDISILSTRIKKILNSEIDKTIIRNIFNDNYTIESFINTVMKVYEEV